MLCYANIAFAAIRSSDIGRALSMLDLTMAQLKQRMPSQEPPSPWDLPGIGKWVAQADQIEVREEPPASALSLIEDAIQKVEHRNQVPDDVREMAELYGKAAGVYQSRGGRGKKWWWPFG